MKEKSRNAFDELSQIFEALLKLLTKQKNITEESWREFEKLIEKFDLLYKETKLNPKLLPDLEMYRRVLNSKS